MNKAAPDPAMLFVVGISSLDDSRVRVLHKQIPALVAVDLFHSRRRENGHLIFHKVFSSKRFHLASDGVVHFAFLVKHALGVLELAEFCIVAKSELLQGSVVEVEMVGVRAKTFCRDERRAGRGVRKLDECLVYVDVVSAETLVGKLNQIITQRTDDQRNILRSKLAAERAHYRRDLLKIEFISRLVAIRLTLMPKNCNEVRGAHSKARAVDRVIEEQTALLPLIERRAAVSARDNSNLDAFVIVCISRSKALDEASARKGSVGVYGAVHILPSARF